MPKQIVIVGAGISGLTAAWKIQKASNPKDIEITILEKNNRVGGWIETIQKEGFLFEQGPRSCRSSGNGRATLELIEELGLSSRVIGADPSAYVRYLYFNNKLRQIPRGIWTYFPKVISGCINDLRRYPGLADESIYDFFSRRFNRTIANIFIDPLVSGIFAGDSKKLSIRSCFPSLFELEKQYGSILKGILKKPKEKWNSIVPSLFSLKGGMEELIHALHKQLNVELKMNAEVDRIEHMTEGAIVHLNSGNEIFADQLITSMASKELNYSSVGIVSLGYRKEVLPKKGFGYLIPSVEGESILGCVWDSCVFPQQNRKDETRLTVMLGGVRNSEIVSMNESKAIDIALNALEKHVGIRAKPDAINYKLARDAIPQYPVGHAEWVENIQLALPSYHKWIGMSVNGVSVNDCIAKS